MPQPTTRKFTTAVKKALADNNQISATVKGSTTSFGGFGYGIGMFATITCPTCTRMPEAVRLALTKVKDEFNTLADEDNKFIINLSGPAYPMGGKI